ncbi:glycosyltransferase family 39 protein [Mastigocladopsis repens]|uniref:glycosyltransferase family 39 protein n=1 Tax=Mastigocladopsis repens TaxID=221287 RepID=UPI000381D679|nr:glycosyltransferase family 39 protein [Mastigocladopsis repens]
MVGVFFHFFNLNKKVYWHDEVYTSMRAAGFTRDEIDQEIFQNRIIPAPQLQKYQHLKPGSTAADTIKSLAVEDPQHPPLYFLIARFWMQGFGSSLTASRILPVLFSLLALPFIYALGIELFASQTVAILATALIAISPFDILFAQTARQYSLLTATVIGSNFLLLRALRLSTWRNWGLYTLANTVGWYTHPFFGLTIIAQGAYILLFLIIGKKQKAPKALQALLKFFLAIACSLFLYTPWLIVLVTNHQRASATTDWTKVNVEFIYLVKLWILSFSSLFLDLDLGFDSVWTYLLRLLIILIIGIAIYTVCRCTSQTTWLFILTSIFVPFLMLVLPDLLLGGKRSAVSRYLISCYPGIQLAVAYLLATKILHRRQIWRGVMLLLMTGAIASSTVSAFSESWWNTDLSYFNAEVVRRINDTSSPVVISEIGDDYTNTGDLISMSYLLHDNVSLLLLSQPPQLENVKSLLPNSVEPFVFRPSKKFIESLKPEQGKIVQVFPEGRLWQIKK